MAKVNCWERKSCGRQPGGAKTQDLGVCPASIEKRLDGVHDGKNGGRACWVVAGTYCRGEVQGSFAQKFFSCQECEHFREVLAEENNVERVGTSELLRMLGQKD